MKSVHEIIKQNEMILNRKLNTNELDVITMAYSKEVEVIIVNNNSVEVIDEADLDKGWIEDDDGDMTRNISQPVKDISKLINLLQENADADNYYMLNETIIKDNEITGFECEVYNGGGKLRVAKKDLLQLLLYSGLYLLNESDTEKDKRGIGIYIVEHRKPNNDEITYSLQLGRFESLGIYKQFLRSNYKIEI